MASGNRRFRSSTTESTPSNTKSFGILRGLLDGLAHDAESALENGYPDTARLAKGLRTVSGHILAGDVVAHQDDFRRAGGFERVLDVLRRFSGYSDLSKRSETELLSLFSLLGSILGVLSSAFKSHSGNRRFFRHRVLGGGWEALEQAIASIGLGGAERDPWVSCQLFGKLLAFAFDDEALDLLCQSIAKALRPESDSATQNQDEDGVEEQWDLVLAHSVENIEPSVREIVNARSTIQYPEILRAVVGFWMVIPRAPPMPSSPGSLVVLETILCAISVSPYNLAGVHSTRVLSQFLRAALCSPPCLNDVEREKALAICKTLMYLGVNEPADAQFLLLTPGAESSEFYLEMLSKYSGPPFFQFDLSIQGYCSLEVPTLDRAFPPQSSLGYTWTAWIRIGTFDSDAHTTLFGVFDASQTCFVLMYLEKDTHNFILQTSVVSNKPSVRFKSVAFKEDKWYHIAIVHRRPKTMVASKASLYVNGEFMEQIRCNYPQSPPLSTSGRDSFVTFDTSQNRTNPVQAFFGTPRELSDKISPGVVVSRWCLASAHLFKDALSDELLAVYHALGPRYQGNYQDSLGGFQTYEASAKLGLRNELLHQGKDERSHIIKAIRDKASALMPESKIMLSILPTATFPENVQHPDGVGLGAIPRESARNLHRALSQGGSRFAINCALPCPPDALLQTEGLAFFQGSLIVAVPSYLDENLWRLAGFTPLALGLLERASTADEAFRAIEITFHSIRKNWRNSEAMERDNGYVVLGMLLRFKLGYGASSVMDSLGTKLSLSNEERDRLAFQILSLVLGFVGHSHEEPSESFIINPLAYRILLIDLDIWRRSSPRVQELYYRQFLTFAVESKYRSFNSRRLVRMRIVKRLLDAMKGEVISEDVVHHFMSAFEALVTSNLSPEVMRALSLYITYAFHAPSLSLARTARALSSLPRPSTPGLARRGTGDAASIVGASSSGQKFLTKKQLGTKILCMFSRILCQKGNLAYIKKFARTVTNKWLLYLLAEDDDEIVMHGCKILARILVVHGPAYTNKFSAKSGGFSIMANRLKRFWHVPTIWPICFSMLFGYDISDAEVNGDFERDALVDILRKKKVIYPESSVILTSMLQQGLRDLVRHQEDPESPSKKEPAENKLKSSLSEDDVPRTKSSDFAGTIHTRPTFLKDTERIAGHTLVLQMAVRFLTDLHVKSSEFRDFTASSEWVRMILSALYPVVVSTDALSPDVELNSDDSALTFDGSDVIIRPIGGASAPAPIVRTSNVAVTPYSLSMPPKGTALRRASSFVLLTSQSAPPVQGTARFTQAVSLHEETSPELPSGVVLDSLLELIMRVFMDQILARKEFPGFGLFTKVPPGFQEHHAYFESYILKKAITRVDITLQGNMGVICEPRILTNLSRLCLHLTEAIFEGWFMRGAEIMVDFNGMLLEFLQRPEVAKLKSVRLCSQAVSTIRNCFLRIILLKLSDLDEPTVADTEAKSFMKKMGYWQMSILDSFTADDEYLKLFCYQLYTKLIADVPAVRIAAANMLRIILVQRPAESAAVIRSCVPPDKRHVSREFEKLTEVDDDTFVNWVDQHRPSLDGIFFGSMAKSWEDYVNTENQRTFESAKNRLSKRRERLKAWRAEDASRGKLILDHEIGNTAWVKSIYTSEYFKYQRLLQDQQDDLVFLASTYKKMDRELTRPGAVFSGPATYTRWKVDRTEGRNRMRLRLLPDYSDNDKNPQPKRKQTGDAPTTIRPNTLTNPVSPNISTPTEGLTTPTPSVGNGSGRENQEDNIDSSIDQKDAGFGPEEDFELVDDPNDPNDIDEGFEDKNRKVMRRLEHGDQVQAAYNISRVTGLEACEGILIVGKDALYMMDNVFQCANGDIVNVWQAPPDERDPFTQIVTGQKTWEKRLHVSDRDQESRHWKWQDVISVSKRRFLFRDVAVELFFTDGRSYLLTTMNCNARDDLFSKMLSKAPHISGMTALPNPEDAWRLEVLRAFDESPQGLGSRLGTFFNSSPWNPALKRWQRGEMSNFHYLMMVNTMAGRTFNDLTQYPVFPWILADYASEDLDLEDPATFRDLSKPMGAQTPNRVPSFMETYNALSEIGQTPFHYGTHYSSAMIVSSYLIRLPPFVQSYLLVQGDSFDHADRLFHSVPDAWLSASCNNKTDVRELIPEFFCLPEFLTNINGYEFGHRQSNGAKVDNVTLPPWAKGDPKIFIAKHREALESPYVSEHLHQWIDLIFGNKQRGEAAVENLNVFHHLSYGGSSDLDRITDANERAITAGVIHNFGQTPHQIFTKPHPARECVQSQNRRLDSAIFSLSCLPNPLLEAHGRISSLVYAPKLDRLLSTSAFRLNFAPYDKHLQWGYGDNSIRFFFADSRKPAGLFENLHTGQISCVSFADSKTLITAGEDCVVSVYTVQTAPGKPVDLVPRSSLFGHKTPVSTIAVSKALSTFVTVSSDGQAFLWDLNQLSFIRKLPLVRQVECAQINDVSGEIMLCSGPNVLLYTLNGTLILEQNVCLERDDFVHSCAFYEGAANEWLENYLVFTGHGKGRVNVWRRSVKSGKWTLELLRRLDHIDYNSGKGDNTAADITSITPLPTCLYAGDDNGRVYEWNFANRDR